MVTPFSASWASGCIFHRSIDRRFNVSATASRKGARVSEICVNTLRPITSTLTAVRARTEYEKKSECVSWSVVAKTPPVHATSSQREEESHHGRPRARKGHTPELVVHFSYGLF